MALLDVDDARARILSVLKPLPHEEVRIEEAIDRTVVLTVNARRTLPPFDNSAMDGFAVRAAEVGEGVVLPVSLTIFAGDAPPGLPVGTVARIMTGATLPAGADAVVMQEHVTREGERARFQGVVKPGLNVRRRGEDVQPGTPVALVGQALSVADAGLLWAQGLTHVPVHRRPRVGIVSSGDELVDPGSTDETKIVDSNSPVIEALVRKAGGVPVRLGRAADTLESTRAHFEKGLDCDVLITLAGASVGDKDFTRAALEGLGVEMHFWKVAMRPGKPLAFGGRGATAVFGLPGNPVSAMVTFDVFVRPALRALQGLTAALPPVPARLEGSLASHPELRLFVRARAEIRDGAIWARPVKSQSSGALTSASAANALIDVRPGALQLEHGNEISLFPTSWGAF